MGECSGVIIKVTFCTTLYLMAYRSILVYYRCMLKGFYDTIHLNEDTIHFNVIS